MLPKTLTNTAKTALILAGAGFGLLRGLRLMEGLAEHATALRSFEERLDGMQRQIAALHATDEQLQVRLEGTVAADGLSAALDKALEGVQAGIDARFEDQARSVEALRAMVGQTDELLERLLERLESMRNEAELLHIGA